MWPQNKRKSRDYLNKVRDFLKPFFEAFYLSLEESIQERFLNPSFYQTRAEYVHSLFAEYVQTLDKTTGGRPELDAQAHFRVLHHIKPRFENGGDELENRVFLHQYEHALIHLLRYSWKKRSRDLNGFSSACLTEDQILRRNLPTSQASQDAYAKTTRNPEWQASHGRKGRENRSTPVPSPLQRRKVAQVGEQTQWSNSRQRVIPFTWFLCSQVLAFKNDKSNTLVWISPPLDLQERTVTNIAKVLVQHPLHRETNSPEVLEKLYSNFAELFRGTRKMKWNWRFYALRLGDHETYSLHPVTDPSNFGQLQTAFATLFFALYQKRATVDLQQLKSSFCREFDADFTASFLEALFQSVDEFVQNYEEIVPVVTSANQKHFEDLQSLAKNLTV